MFKEDWEKTSVLRELSEDDVQGMVRAWSPKAKVASYQILDGGCANVNVKVLVEGGGAPVLLRLYIRDTLMAKKEQKINALLRGKVHVPGAFDVCEYNGSTFAVAEFLEGETLREFFLREKGPSDRVVYKVMFALGKDLAELRKVTFEKSGFFDENLDVVDVFAEDGYLDFARQIIKTKTLQKIFSTGELDAIVKCLEKNKAYFPSEEECSLVHGDFNPANILVGEGGCVTGVLDFEYAFSGSTLADIADMLREAHLMPPAYKEGFLMGLAAGGCCLPEKLDQSVCVINIVTLLDCIVSSPEKPKLVANCKELIAHMQGALQKEKEIEVVPYDPRWKEQFEEEALKIRECLGKSAIEIYHFGSTSVPGLASKRDLDIILVVDDLKNSLGLQRLGYVFKDEIHIPLRYFFSKNTEKVKVNLHVCEKGHGFIELNLKVRDYLREHENVRNAYQDLKYKILEEGKAGTRFKGRLSRYGHAKNPFIKDLLDKSGYDGFMVNLCFHEREWEAAKRLSGHKSFEEGEGHMHFVLYRGTEIIGYAHLEIKEGKPQLSEMKGEEQEFFKRFIKRWEIKYGKD